MYRLDSNNNPDYCRVAFSPVDSQTQELIKTFKLQVNALMAQLHREIKPERHPEVKRLLTHAMTNLEDASMWAVKAMSYEFWDKQAPTAPGTDQT